MIGMMMKKKAEQCRAEKSTGDCAFMILSSRYAIKSLIITRGLLSSPFVTQPIARLRAMTTLHRTNIDPIWHADNLKKLTFRKTPCSNIN